MTHEELKKKISLTASINEDKIATLLESFSDIVSARLLEGDAILLPGLGQLEAIKENEKIINLPSDPQERYLVPPRIMPVLHPDSELYRQIQSRKPKQ